MDNGATRSRVIRYSLRAFVSGLLSLIPLLGLPAAVLALVFWFQALRRSRRAWNPASTYLHLGAIFALVGITMTAGGTALIIYLIVNSTLEPDYNGGGFYPGFLE